LEIGLGGEALICEGDLLVFVDDLPCRAVRKNGTMAQKNSPVAQSVDGSEVVGNKNYGTAIFAQFCNASQTLCLKGRIANR